MGYAGWDENPGFSSHLAEGEGFEPPVPEGTAVFETAPFGHSGTPPRDIFSVVPPACGKGGIPRSAGQSRFSRQSGFAGLSDHLSRCEIGTSGVRSATPPRKRGLPYGNWMVKVKERDDLPIDSGGKPWCRKKQPEG